MKFAEFSTYLEKLEATPSRLEITRILSQMIKKLDPSDIAEGIFLSLGSLGPSYERLEFGISEKLMVKIIARAFLSASEEVTRLFKSEGDLGVVAQTLGIKNSEPACAGRSRIKGLSVGQVFGKLKEMAEAAGAGSVERKVNLGARLLQSLDPLSVRFAVRIPLGTMRLGFSEKTVLEALAAIDAGGEISFARNSKSREVKEMLERKFNIYPNIGEIAAKFTERGLSGLRAIKVKVGAPVEPQLCARLETAEEMVKKVGDGIGRVAAEYKYDGIRLQVHLDREASDERPETKQEQFSILNSQFSIEKVKMFTRNFEQMQGVFPDLSGALLQSVKAESAILDGEAVGFDPQSGKFIPFQETIQRKRKYNVSEMIKKVPVKYFAFDILYKDGQDLTGLPYLKRREILVLTIARNDKIVISQSLATAETDELQTYFKEAKRKGLEGLIVKNPASPYEAGNRGFAWVKFKREETKELSDTIDCVVLGYYKGAGKRAGFGIGAFLVGVYDERDDKFLSIAKIGTGLTDEEWRELKLKTQNSKLKTLPKDVEIPKDLMPDVLCQPKIVVQIRADEITVSPVHTSGYALRFPRMMGYRSDKRPERATTLSEIRQLHRMQQKR